MTKLSSINANLLVVLEAVLDERSVGRAAKRLRLSQPAVSNHMAKLRDLFADELLVRVGRGMELTPRAEALLPKLREGISAFENLLEEPAAFAPERCESNLRVAMADMAEVVLLPRSLARLRSEAPRASIQIFSAGVFDVSHGLATGELDAVVTVVETRELGNRLFETKLYATSLVVIARQGHPAIQGSLSVEDYAALEHVIVTSRPDARGVIDVQLEELGLYRRIALRVPRSVLVPPLIATTDLVAAIDTPALLPYGDQLPLEQVAVQGLDLPVGSMSLVWHERAHRSPEQRWLRRVLQEEASSLSVRATGPA